ncbi:S-methyl-5'-thioadenosine phosphorylase [Kalaharituber pfeilii]|nr:S-methyl-5'-thioadenosine phosphorylase [Kalaharituber pfeilii]
MAGTNFDPASLPTTYPHPVRIAVIGGTGISHLTHSGFTPAAILHVTTPWGAPSSPIMILHTPHNAHPIAFLARHGLHHQLTPSEVPSIANIAALRSIGVRTVIAFSAVGSLREEIRPRDFVVPSQIFDRTKGIRKGTFFGDGIVGHVGFADPFDRGLTRIVERVGERVLGERGGRLHVGGTLVCMEGPQFSTRAESHFYRTAISDSVVINMSALPESKLAREAELAYVMICMSTDYDCWKEDEEAVTVETVMGNMHANSETARVLVAAVLEELVKEEHIDLVEARHLQGQSGWACCSDLPARKGEAWKRLQWLLPESFKEPVEN